MVEVEIEQHSSVLVTARRDGVDLKFTHKASVVNIEQVIDLNELEHLVGCAVAYMLEEKLKDVW